MQHRSHSRSVHDRRRAPPLLSTVLLSWNRADLLERTLDSYFATTRAEYELFIVDNGSTDASRTAIERLARGRPNVVALFLPRNLGGRALNFGLRRARGRFLHFSENDVEYLAGWDAELLETLERFPEVGQLSLFSPFYELNEGEVGLNRRGRELRRGGAAVYLTERHVPAPSLVRREALSQGARWRSLSHGSVKLPDAADFSTRVRKAGFGIAWNGRHVAHDLGNNLREIVQRPAYYAELYRAKRVIERVDFGQVLEAHGYALQEDAHGSATVQRLAPSPAVPVGAALISASAITVVDERLLVSRVYDDGRRIYKQATGDLACREAWILERLSGCRFPRVLDLTRSDGEAVVVLEKIEGSTLARSAASIRADPYRLRRFFLGCLDILQALQEAGVQHRDIHERNLLVRDGEPVLIDFGWAAAPDHPNHPPPDRIWTRPPDGSLCDVYSMGRVLEDLVPEEQSALRTVSGLMAEPDPELRITDPAILRALVESLAREQKTRQGNGEAISGPSPGEAAAAVRVEDRLIARLMHQIALLRARSPTERPATQQEEIPVATRSPVAAAWRRARSAVHAVLLRAAERGGAAGRRIFILAHRCR